MLGMTEYHGINRWERKSVKSKYLIYSNKPIYDSHIIGLQNTIQLHFLVRDYLISIVVIGINAASYVMSFTLYKPLK
jgi:hypothetical protein